MHWHDAPVELSREGHVTGGLYFRWLDGRIASCRALTPLLALRRPLPPLNVRHLLGFAASVAHGDLTSTFYEGVGRVPPFHTVRIGRSAVEWLRLDLPPVHPIALAVPEAAEELRRRLRRSVARAIAGADRVAVFVSGGLDSSAVLAALVALERGATRREIEAIQYQFDGSWGPEGLGDDRPYLEDLARALGIVPIRVAPATGGPRLLEAFSLDSTPLAACEGYGLVSMEHARERRVDTTLIGISGDDMCDVEPWIASEMLLRGEVVSAFRLAAEYHGVGGRAPGMLTAASQVGRYALRPALTRQAPVRMRRWWRRRAEAAPSWAGPALADLMAREAEALYPGRWRGTPHERAAAGWSTRIRVEVADYQGAYEYATGIPVRDPLGDPEVSSFLYALPPRVLLAGGWSRGLLRLAMEPEVPSTLRWRTTKGAFGRAQREQLQAAGGTAALGHLLDFRALQRLGVVRPERLREALIQLETGVSSREGWWPLTLVGLEAFVRRSTTPDHTW